MNDAWLFWVLFCLIVAVHIVRTVIKNPFKDEYTIDYYPILKRWYPKINGLFIKMDASFLSPHKFTEHFEIPDDGCDTQEEAEILIELYKEIVKKQGVKKINV